MTVADVRAAASVDAVEEATGVPRAEWSHQCHAMSLAVVRSGLFGRSRVARGTARGVNGQHSWVVVGDDCYSTTATVVDVTLWSYVPDVPTVWVGLALEWPHVPHGAGSIWSYGQPVPGGGEVVSLTPKAPLSERATEFLRLLGSLDVRGWMALASAPVGGWPAAEVLKAMWETERLAALVPIDRVGMLTDVNPAGLYLP